MLAATLHLAHNKELNKGPVGQPSPGPADEWHRFCIFPGANLSDRAGDWASVLTRNAKGGRAREVRELEQEVEGKAWVLRRVTVALGPRSALGGWKSASTDPAETPTSQQAWHGGSQAGQDMYCVREASCPRVQL